jgi:hypothetical protein
LAARLWLEDSAFGPGLPCGAVFRLRRDCFAWKYRYDVLFLMDGEAAPAVLRQISLKEGVDTAYSGRGVVYFRRLTARAAQSHLSRLVSLPVYKRVTVRNWNTTTRLAQLLDGAINRGAGKE